MSVLVHNQTLAQINCGPTRQIRAQGLHLPNTSTKRSRAEPRKNRVKLSKSGEAVELHRRAGEGPFKPDSIGISLGSRSHFPDYARSGGSPRTCGLIIANERGFTQFRTRVSFWRSEFQLVSTAMTDSAQVAQPEPPCKRLSDTSNRGCLRRYGFTAAFWQFRPGTRHQHRPRHRAPS